MKSLLVTDKPEEWGFANDMVDIVNAFDYISMDEYSNGKPLRVINLCQNYSYQSLGYYVSLLAQARGHKILPSVLAIQDVMNPTLATVISQEIEEDIAKAFKNLKSKEFVLSVYFGRNIAERYCALAHKLDKLFAAPLFRVYFKFQNKWKIKRIAPISIEEVPKTHHEFLFESARTYFNKKRFHRLKKHAKYYDLAILVNPEEQNPPSNKQALQKFVKAAEDLCIDVTMITKDDFKSIAEYDALFIRETTAVNHHTYRFARKATSERLTVMDDPDSILKCTNKVYLAELLNKNKIATPETIILSKQNWKNVLSEITYPCVLKKPDSYFSQGVLKINDIAEMKHNLSEFFKASELIIVQAFMPTEYDWRIGVLDHKPIYANRYYMAKGHWQIYNWQSKAESEGDDDSVPLAEVPRAVLQTAIKATHLIGDGLYGVDLKQIGNDVYVIEINDNPSIDSDVEDKVLGDKLYHDIMQVFLSRIRKQHGYE